MPADLIEDLYPLTAMQLSMLLHTLGLADSSVGVEQLRWILRGRLDVQAFQGAWQCVTDRHPVLRTAFNWEDFDDAMQVVYRQVALPCDVTDWRTLPPGQQREQLDAQSRAAKQRGFALSEAPLLRLALYRLADDEYACIWTFHHVLIDRWSLELLLGEVFALYAAARKGEHLQLKRPRPFGDYIAWLQQQSVGDAEAYWRRTLRGFTAPTVVCLPGAALMPIVGDDEYGREDVVLPAAATAGLRDLARRGQISMNTLLQGAWALLLAHYSDRADVVFGITVSGRPAELPGVDSMIGMFINNVPVRAMIRPEGELLPWLQELHRQQLEARQYDYSAPAQIQAWSEVPPRLPLFTTLLVVQNVSLGGAPAAPVEDLLITDTEGEIRTAYPLTLVVELGTETLLDVVYDRRHFAAASVARLAADLRGLLGGMIGSPEQRLETLLGGIVDARGEVVEERQWALGPTPEALHMLESTLELHPAVREAAVRIVEEQPGERRLIAYLVEDRERIAPDGTTKQTGDLSIDTDYGTASYHDDDSRTGVLAWINSYTGLPMEDEEVREQVEQTVERVLALRPRRVLDVGCGSTDVLRRIAPTCASYWATGFTTDMHSRIEQALCLEKLSHVRCLERQVGDFTGIEPQSFDVVFFSMGVHSFSSIDEVMRSLQGAVKLTAPGGAIFLSGIRSLPLLEAFHASVLRERVSPSTSTEELRARVALRVAAEEDLVIDPAFFNAMKDVLPQITHVLIQPRRGRHHNEMTRFWYDVTLYTGLSSTPLDNPYQEFFRLLFGYWQHSEFSLPSLRRRMTEEQPPMLGIARVPDARLQRDLAALELLRHPEGPKTVADLRLGMRHLEKGGVDPEDIWALASDFPYAVDIGWSERELPGHFAVLLRRRDCIQARGDVAAFPDLPLPRRRWGAYANRPARSLPSLAREEDLRRFVRRRMPEELTPSKMIWVEALPSASNNTPVSTPGFLANGAYGTPVPPRDALEDKLVAIWRQVLGVEAIGVTDDFFDLGGHSVLAMIMLGQIQREIGRKVSIAALFKGRTIAQLADVMRSEYPAETSAHLVEIHPNGSKPPLFIIDLWGHAADGTLLYCRHFPAHLGEDQPVYGLQWDSLDDPNTKLSVEEVSASFARDIRSVAPNGPYFITGLSLAGVIAFETARQIQLADASQQVYVSMLDTPCPPYGPEIVAHEKASESEQEVAEAQYKARYTRKWVTLFDKVKRHIRSLAPLSTREKVAYAYALIRRLRTRVAKTSTVADGSSEPVELGADDAFMNRWVLVDVRNYTPGVLNGKVTIFLARAWAIRDQSDARLRWEEHTTQGLETREVSGDHVSMVVEPHVHELAAEIKAWLAARQEDAATVEVLSA